MSGGQTNVEWLEVRIVVQNECLTIESYIEALNGDREPLENERYFSSVTNDVTNSSAMVFKEKIRRLIRRTQGLHGDWEEHVCRGELCVLFALPGSSQFSDYASSTSCGSDVRLCYSAHNCDVPHQQLSRAPRYLRHSVRPGRPPTPELAQPCH